jgi:hypothetical protein
VNCDRCVITQTSTGFDYEILQLLRAAVDRRPFPTKLHGDSVWGITEPGSNVTLGDVTGHLITDYAAEIIDWVAADSAVGVRL